MVQFETGIVKWFDNAKGCGIIVRDHGGEVYVHYSAILCEEGDCALDEGAKVRFMVVKGPQGSQAQEVVVVE